jgi:CDP-4-dehydro-6-deoxyglucose reductase
VLAQRLFRQSQELADTQRHLQRYHALVIALRANCHAAGAVAAAVARGRPRLSALQHQLNDGLARALATESVDRLDVMDDMLKMVSAQVTLRPSGHQFAVEGHDTLLQAGLRAGLKLNYGCGNGSCGMCKVRVTDGQVVRTMHTDYALSETERTQGYVLSCAHTAASSELTIETLEAAGPDDIPAQQIVTTVRALRPLAPDTLLLHLQTPRSHRLRFLAGQAVTLGLPPLADGNDVHATHAIASCPCDDRNLQFFVPRDAVDPVAARLFDGGVKVGDAVTVWGPSGRFVLAEGAHPLVFAACDTGIAPVKSLIEHALSLDDAPSISLFWLTTRPDGHFIANQCRAWSEALDPFEYALSTHDDAATGASLMASAMRADLFDIDCTYYIAGPADFAATLVRELGAAGVADERLHSEVIG